MRVIGYLLLIFGFILMPAIFMAEYHAITGEVPALMLHSLPAGDDTKAYTWHEWREMLGRAFDEKAKTIPTIYVPTIMMLIGAILLDIAGCRRRKAKMQPNTSLEPTATAPSVSTKP
jgi:hypothetical protein